MSMQPEDVYETSDLPESDQVPAVEEKFDSEHIVKVKLKVGEAHQTFKGKSLHTDGVDFSDSIGRRRKGYAGDTFLVEVVRPTDGEPETAVQQYKRLQDEIRELADKIEQIKVETTESVKNEKNADSLTIVDVNDLQKHLKQLQLEQILGVETKGGILDSQAGLLNQVLSAVDRCKQQKQQKGKDAPSPVTYELYCTPGANLQKAEGLAPLNKLTILEARLSALEKLTGIEADRNFIVQDAKSKNVLESIDNLEQRLSLLDNNQLDLIDARLSIILHKLSQVKDKKSILNAEQSGKVDELYEMMRKWDALCSSLPQIVSRLQSLKDLHEQALQFSQSITYLDGVQQELNKTLESDVSLLNEMKDTFGKNADAFKNNCENVEKRLKALTLTK